MRPATCALLLLAASCAAPAAAQKEIGGAGHRAEAALLDAVVSGRLGATPLPTPECANDTSGAADLARDALFYLSALGGAGRVSGMCEPGPPGREACRVVIGESVPGTERRWSRVYQFLRRSDGEADAATLACSTIP